MSIASRKFGEHKGSDIYAYTLSNGKGLSAEILNYGGIITKLIYNGVDVVLGWKGMEEYAENEGCMGAIIGRNSNRLKDAWFELNGQVYKLAANNGKNNHHGGPEGFDQRIWDAECVDGDEPSLVLRLISPDDDQGFPGELQVMVTYTLTDYNAIKIHYEAVSDSDTIVNMTNHSYFNPNGHGRGSVENCKLWLASSFYAANDEDRCPDGRILSVENTPFDFREEKVIADNLKIENEQISLFGGYDHSFAIEGRGLRKAAVCTGDKSGITIETYTDRPVVQVYLPTCSYEGNTKDGATYGPMGAICFETQAFPNSMKLSHFPTIIVKADEMYDSTTLYRFK